MSKLQSKSRRHRHSSNPNELHIEVSGTTTQSTRKKLNIQHDLAPGENVYVTYKRIYIENSLVTENRYADVVIHAPKES